MFGSNGVYRAFSRAFSIVEILIVITVVCILAAVLVQCPTSGEAVSISTPGGLVPVHEGDFVRVDAVSNPDSRIKLGTFYVVTRRSKTGVGWDLGLMSSISTDFTIWLSPGEYGSAEDTFTIAGFKRGSDEHAKAMEVLRPGYSAVAPR